VQEDFNNAKPLPEGSARSGARLRTIGVVVLLLGFGGAGLVYWTGTPPEDLSDDPDMARAYKTEAREIEKNFGKMGLLLNDLREDLRQPGTQAVMIVVASTLVASGCFYVARLLARGAELDKEEG
jgi:hypothetical protein